MATKAGAEGLRALVKDLAEYFYADDRLVLSTQMERLHRVFDVLIDLLNQVGTQKNTWKTESMSCHPFHTPGIMSVVAYERQVTGMGMTYKERQRMRVQCPECGVEVALVSLLTHRQSQHIVGRV